MRSTYYIEVAGQDVTSAFTDASTDITVTDGSGSTADSASISVADDNGALLLPTEGDDIKIGLGWEEPVLVFEGVIEKINSTGSRGGGRSLSISAKSADTGKGKLKEPQQKHRDDATLGDVAADWARAAGVSETFIHPDLASISRAYWSMNGESFIAWGERIARTYGATFKIMGGRLVMVPRSAGVSSDGRPLTRLRAVFGGNLISWAIDTARGRPKQKAFSTRHFDRKEAAWKSESEEAEYESEAEAEDLSPFPEADAETARSRSRSRGKESDRDRGGGSIEIDGEPAAQAEAAVDLVGARPGVDGTYTIDSVTHRRSRSGGFTTSLSVKRPGEGVGKDTRQSEPAAKGAKVASRAPASSSESPAPSSGAAATKPARPSGIGSDAAIINRAGRP